MLTVEVQDAAGRTTIGMDILPTTQLPAPIVQQQYANACTLAPSLGLQFYFLVAADRIVGWRVGQQQPSFNEATAAILGTYGATDAELRKSREIYLARLVQAWLSDLATHWKSAPGKAPGEDLLQSMGAMAFIEASTTATTGSL